jgi:flavin reductase (DIM6/NTAB) family NADH-FMN oxidoreductase RutF
MLLTKQDIKSLQKVRRLNIINSITGIKPANLVGTKSKNGLTNLAIISSVVHLGSNPAFIGFIMRPTGTVPRHTYENIKETGVYTINHVHESFIKQAHYTSAKFDRDESEFDGVKLTEEYLDSCHAPFVKESQLKMSLSLVEEVSIKINGTIMLVGEIQQLIIPDEVVSEEGHINLSKLNTAGISGLNSYYGLNYIDSFPYARKKELPEF